MTTKPELPDPVWLGDIPGYTATQMHNYAARVCAERDALIESANRNLGAECTANKMLNTENLAWKAKYHKEIDAWVKYNAEQQQEIGRLNDGWHKANEATLDKAMECNALKAENAALRDANTLLDSALILMNANGAQGYVFELWNKARAVLEETK
jgi:hypothetical protein